MFAWARRDPKVAQRVAAIEEERLGYLREIAIEVGYDKGEADRVAMLAYLAFIGWVDRASRAPEATPSFPAFSVSLERLVIPGAGGATRRPRNGGARSAAKAARSRE
jgi:hypothetical protein